MAKLPQSITESPIVKAIDAHHESMREDPRTYLGVSVLGHPCDRYLWLNFRWTVVEKFTGRMLRLFRRGQREEDTVIEDLRAIGCEISEGSRQAKVDFGKHVRGSGDGIIERGVPGAEKARHVLEIKTHSTKSFAAVVKDGVAKSKPMHFIQTQVYMLGLKIDRALYYPVNKNDDEVNPERLHLDKTVATNAVHRGQRIALSLRMAEPVMGAGADWHQCKYCPANEFCFSRESYVVPQNCRTCEHVRPFEDGTWACAFHEATDLDVEYQKVGCDDYEVNKDLAPQVKERKRVGINPRRPWKRS